MKNKHVWLVLSGSGMKLYAFIGAIVALTAHGYTFSGVTGTSGGAIVAGLLGKHWDPNNPYASAKRMVVEARSINPGRELIRSFRWRVWEWLMTKVFRAGPRGAFDSSRLLAKFRQHLPATTGECSLPVHVVAYQVNLKSPRTVIFDAPDTDLPLAVLGSMSLPPPLFDPVIYGKAMLQDGGWTKNLAIPDQEPHVVALYFGDVGEDNLTHGIIEDDAQIVDVKDNISLWMKTVFGVIDTNMRESIAEAAEDGIELTRIRLKTSIDGFDFFADADKISDAINEGFTSVSEYLRSTEKEGKT